jgi:hypothetical protein
MEKVTAKTFFWKCVKGFEVTATALPARAQFEQRAAAWPLGGLTDGKASPLHLPCVRSSVWLSRRSQDGIRPQE